MPKRRLIRTYCYSHWRLQLLTVALVSTQLAYPAQRRRSRTCYQSDTRSLLNQIQELWSMYVPYRYLPNVGILSKAFRALR